MAYRVYITDKHGIVIFDSIKRDEGKDYSRWNDVYLTLRGKYGARTTREDPKDGNSSVMYVAAPIKMNDEIVGVLTVSKPTRSLSVVINRGEQQILYGGMILIAMALFVGIVIILWINRSIRKLVNYATQVSNEKVTVLPKFTSPELRTLANALENMRLKLDGKDYIEKYVHTLAHEMKSPLSSVRAATEILQDALQNSSVEKFDKIKETQTRFLSNIEQQTQRMNELIERMLLLARLESRVGVNFEYLQLNEIITQVVESKQPVAERSQIKIIVNNPLDIKVKGDKFLLSQAISNLVGNALEFTPINGVINIDVELQPPYCLITIKDTGTGIPDYALERIFERFYSLPRPNKAKSSGLGLSFVKEVAILHSGDIVIKNRTDQKGTIATFSVLIN